jgi:acyl-CoA thioester hydrolase
MPDAAEDADAGTVRLPLRFRDLDAFGHVYHAEYLTLLDEARTAWFRDGLRLDDAGDYVLARVEVDYLSSLVRTDRWVSAVFAVERVGGTSLTLREELHADDGRVVARGRSVCVLRDLASGSSRPVTDAERARIEAYAAR